MNPYPINWKLEMKRLLAVTGFTIFYGFGVIWFLEASDVPLYTGGIPGIAQLVRDILFVVFDVDLGQSFLGIFILVANIPILILGWFGVSHRFTIYSLVSVVLQAFLLGFIPIIDLGLSGSEHALAAASVGGLIIGLGAGGALKYGTSTGGFDILAQYFALKTGHTVGYFSLIINISIAVIGGFVVGGQVAPSGEIILGGVIASYTIIRIIISSIGTDIIHTSYSFLSVEIITIFPQPIAEDILSKIYRGVTLANVEGAYSHTQKTMMYVVIATYELNTVLEIVRKIDPHAFVITKPVKNVYGNFKRKTIA